MKFKGGFALGSGFIVVTVVLIIFAMAVSTTAMPNHNHTAFCHGPAVK